MLMQKKGDLEELKRAHHGLAGACSVHFELKPFESFFVSLSLYLSSFSSVCLSLSLIVHL